MDDAGLEQAIRAAFDPLPILATNNLLTVNNSNDPDAIEIRRRFGGKSWPILLQELLDMDITERNFFHSLFYLFTHLAFHYYLPAFMLITLKPIQADLVGEYLFYALSPSEVSGDFVDRWFNALAALVTPVQREAIRSLILSVSVQCQQLQIGDITDEENLRRYWYPEGFPE